MPSPHSAKAVWRSSCLFPMTSLVRCVTVQRALPCGVKCWGPTSSPPARQGGPGEVLERGHAVMSHGTATQPLGWQRGKDQGRGEGEQGEKDRPRPMPRQGPPSPSLGQAGVANCSQALQHHANTCLSTSKRCPGDLRSKMCRWN